MRQVMTLFVSTFSTLLAIINPFEVLPVFLKMLEGQDAGQHRQIARRSCVYAVLLLFFFLIFGTLILRIFDISLSMVRVVGGIILIRIGFELFSGSSSSGSLIPSNKAAQQGDIAFVPHGYRSHDLELRKGVLQHQYCRGKKRVWPRAQM